MTFPNFRILSSAQLVRLIKESNENGERFCFILGSGASVESKIPSGNALEMEWMNYIMDEKNVTDIQKTTEYLYQENLIEHSFNDIKEAWITAKETGKSISSIYYFDIYKLRFFPNLRNGYRYLEKIMDGRDPSLGYHTLAKLLTKNNQNNLVITTNFDSLVEDALFLYTNKKPLVVSHESLAGYIESDIQRPIIAKVHRGLMFKPFNTPETTNQLQTEWTEALNYAFNTYTPIVIGYAGGDRSLMTYLRDNTTMRNGIYWCYREASGLPEKDIQNFIKDKEGYFVSIKGFDALMMEIGNALYQDAITPTGTETYLKKQFAERVSRYNEQWNKLNENSELKEVLQPINEAEQIEEKKREKQDILTVWDYIRRGNRASEEKKYQKAIEEYTNALKLDPKESAAYYNRGLAYHDLKQYDTAISDYSKTIELDPQYSDAYNNRGIVYDDLKQYDMAISDYSKAIELDPQYAIAYNNRGVAYKNLKQYDTAISNYSKAIELDPQYANAYYNRGIVYYNLKQYDTAISDYSKVIDLNPQDAVAYNKRAKAYHAIGKKALAEADEAYAKKLSTQ